MPTRKRYWHFDRIKRRDFRYAVTLSRDPRSRDNNQRLSDYRCAILVKKFADLSYVIKRVLKIQSAKRPSLPLPPTSPPPPARYRAIIFRESPHFRVGAPLYPGSQWNQCSFTAHHAPSIIRRTPFRFRLGQRSSSSSSSPPSSPSMRIPLPPLVFYTSRLMAPSRFTRAHASAIPSVIAAIVPAPMRGVKINIGNYMYIFMKKKKKNVRGNFWGYFNQFPVFETDCKFVTRSG